MWSKSTFLTVACPVSFCIITKIGPCRCDETADWYYLEIYYDRLRKKAIKQQAEFKAQVEAEAASVVATGA